jgi:hypothetical protein
VTASVNDFVEQLSAVPTVPGRNNFFDHSSPGNAGRRRNLGLYLEEMLDRAPKVLLLGEAPGFRGMRITGVPFTNRTMFQGPANGFGLLGPSKGYSLPPEAADVAAEPTATVMWEVLAELQFLPLLWSACPWHTHVPGKPQSNRTPTVADARAGTPFWQSLAGLFGIETVVAVGNVAHRSLLSSGMDVPKSPAPLPWREVRFQAGPGGSA